MLANSKNPKESKNIDKLKFRRQFLLTTEPAPELKSWNSLSVGVHTLFTHPDLSMFHVKDELSDAVLLGHVLDPKNHDLNESDILRKIIQAPSAKEIAQQIYGLSGRYVLIVKTRDEILFFNDACGLRSFVYTEFNSALQIASQPLLLKLVVGDIVSKGERYYSFYHSDYLKNSKESWYPSGTSLYENIFHLAPNHYLSSQTLQQTRYWPTQEHVLNEYECSLEKFSSLLQSIVVAGSKKYSLGLGVTAGFDSRIILSTTQFIKDKLLYFTLKYRGMTDKSRDIRIPANLNNIMNFNHQVLDCHIQTPVDFAAMYEENSDMAHLDDWGHIAYGVSKTLPQGTMVIKGSCSETGRCYFYQSGIHPKINSGKELLEYNINWKGIPFIEERLTAWFNNLNQPEVNFGYSLLDLFHWEVSTGSWQAQNQLEWDIVHETFTPFNNRELLDTMLRIDPKYRSAPNNFILYRDTINKLWPEALSQPVNPSSINQRVKKAIKTLLVKFGVEKYNH